MRNQRPAAITVAIAICFVNSLGNVATLASPIPRPVAYMSLVLALIGFIGVLGLWRLQRWGALVSTSVLVITAMLAGPGIVIAPILMLHVLGVVIVILDITGIVLMFAPASRQALALRQPTPLSRTTR